ncbi:MAG: carbohydrate kinase family protein [Candidatus Bathyarchaeota archaeon]|nr:MAG: carbohydrate kinase family protein [Candidatus Bathyarchaeota archaeon]
MTGVLCSGSFMCDLIATGLPRIGDPGDLIYAPDGIKLHPGGHAANVAIALAKLGEIDVAAAGSLGTDILGDFMEETLRDNGVGVYALRQADAPTSKNVALVVRGEDRRFYAELAANTMLTPDHVMHALEETRPEVFYQGTIGGLRTFDGHLESVLRRARELGCITFVDVVRPYPGGWGGLEKSYTLIDVLHCNSLESEALTGEEVPLKAATILSERGVALCLLTLGEKGSIAVQGETRLKAPAYNVKAVDTTGAGDAFCAGAISALRRAGIRYDDLVNITRDTLRQVIVEGSAAGAACVTAAGATTAVTRGEVDELISAQSTSFSAGIRLL